MLFNVVMPNINSEVLIYIDESALYETDGTIEYGTAIITAIDTMKDLHNHSSTSLSLFPIIHYRLFFILFV
jgi:hypothetical protein